MGFKRLSEFVSKINTKSLIISLMYDYGINNLNMLINNFRLHLHNVSVAFSRIFSSFVDLFKKKLWKT